jgi:AhpD family alkylhydroperoxidase
MERRTAAMRIDYTKHFPAGAEAMAGLERAVRSSALEPALLELVRVRVSQINGCAYCLAMHNRDARAHGEHHTRLDTVAAWREAPFFTPRERPALAWCETLSELSHVGAPEADFAAHAGLHRGAVHRRPGRHAGGYDGPRRRPGQDQPAPPR